MENPSPEKRPGFLRTLAGPILALIALVVVGNLVGGSWPEIEKAVADLGVAGQALFVALWAVMSATCFPVSVLGFSAGLLYGPWMGLALVVAGGVAGGSLMYLLARGFLRGRIRTLVATRPRFAAIDRMAGREDIKLNVLTRLSPLNFGLASYVLGSGPSRYRAYLAGLGATVPSMVVQVWLGHLAGTTGNAAADEGGIPWGRIVLLVAGIAFFAILSWQVGRMIRRAWTEDPDLPEEPLEGADD